MACSLEETNPTIIYGEVFPQNSQEKSHALHIRKYYVAELEAKAYIFSTKLYFWAIPEMFGTKIAGSIRNP